MSRAVFLDLNGTLVEPVQVESLEHLIPIPGALEALARLNRAGFLCPVITVQSRIAKGYFSDEAFREWFTSFAERALTKGAMLLGPYICPHRFGEACPCAKPNTYLYEQAAGEHRLEPRASYVVGDTVADTLAGVRLGARPALVTTGWGHFESNLAAARAHGAFIGSDLTDVAAWILSRP